MRPLHSYNIEKSLLKHLRQHGDNCITMLMKRSICAMLKKHLLNVYYNFVIYKTQKTNVIVLFLSLCGINLLNLIINVDGRFK